jgi:hypothetical protein
MPRSAWVAAAPHHESRHRIPPDDAVDDPGTRDPALRHAVAHDIADAVLGLTGFDSTAGYTVTSVVVGGISSSCQGRQVSLALVGSGDNKLASGGPGTEPSGGGTVTVTLSGAVAVPLVVRVHAVIS